MTHDLDLNALHALPDDALVGSRHAAALLGLETRTLERWRTDRLIPYVSLGRTSVRYRIGDLRQLIRKRTVPAQAA